MRFSTGTFTSSKNTSLTSWLPSMVWIGRTVMPGVFMSQRMNVMPSCFFAAVSVRRSPALFVEDALPGDNVVLHVADALGGLLADAVRQVVIEERAHLVAKGVLFRCEAKVHGFPPASWAGLTRASIAARWSHFTW